MSESQIQIASDPDTRSAALKAFDDVWAAQREASEKLVSQLQGFRWRLWRADMAVKIVAFQLAFLFVATVAHWLDFITWTISWKVN